MRTIKVAKVVNAGDAIVCQVFGHPRFEDGTEMVYLPMVSNDTCEVTNASLNGQKEQFKVEFV